MSAEVSRANQNKAGFTTRCGQLLSAHALRHAASAPRVVSEVAGGQSKRTADLISPTICWLQARASVDQIQPDRYKLHLSLHASPKDSRNMAEWTRPPGRPLCILTASPSRTWASEASTSGCSRSGFEAKQSNHPYVSISRSALEASRICCSAWSACQCCSRLLPEGRQRERAWPKPQQVKSKFHLKSLQASEWTAPQALTGYGWMGPLRVGGVLIPTLNELANGSPFTLTHFPHTFTHQALLAYPLGHTMPWRAARLTSRLAAWPSA
ncbi:hypothetical protein EYF80_001159 [Liparis tanakae]|uniref:Uncharacterized protein n=1 Tax=Liparis tanakae TaxID=230148 RepID=A0A4Z2JEH8_9TELE|nr:hypothetical protein EYF80_001159 [Liparis tanakae]